MMHQMLADGQNTNTTCKRDKLLFVNYVKFHLTIFYTRANYHVLLIMRCVKYVGILFCSSERAFTINSFNLSYTKLKGVQLRNAFKFSEEKSSEIQ